MVAHLKGEGNIFKLETEGEWILGRDRDVSQFVIEDIHVSREHARLTKTPQGVFVQNISMTKPIFINDVEYSADNDEMIQLHEGDTLKIGTHSFVFSEKDEKSAYDDIFGDMNLEETVEPPPPSREESNDDLTISEGPVDEAGKDDDFSTYDGVFEEPNDSELPLNLFVPSKLVLRVVSGTQPGQEIPLESARTYLIGRDPNKCSIVFHDSSVSAEHAKLTVSQDWTLELEDLSSKNHTRLNGKAISGKTEVKPGEMISVGTTSFWIQDRDAQQDTILFYPTFEVYKEPTAEEPTPAVEEQKEELDWKKKPLPIQHLAAGGAFLIVLFVVFMSFFSLFKSNTIEETKKEPAGKIKEALAKFPDVQFSFSPASGKLFLVGHVTDTVQYQEMLYRIGEVGFIRETDNNVVIDELVWKSANDVISNNSDWRGVTIRSSKAGKFEVVGHVQTAAQAAALSEFLTVNFPYLDRLENNVIIEDNLTLQVQGILVSQGFGSVSFQLSGNELILAGNYSNKKKHDFEKLVKELNKIPGIARVQNFATPANPGAEGINISSQYEVSGNAQTEGTGYSVVLNGKIYFVGDSVDGMEITQIERKTILLEKDGIKYKIDFKY